MQTAVEPHKRKLSELDNPFQETEASMLFRKNMALQEENKCLMDKLRQKEEENQILRKGFSNCKTLNDRLVSENSELRSIINGLKTEIERRNYAGHAQNWFFNNDNPPVC
eukprot:snap_masked-scaffold_1-processed-gene-29.25-mRNA-1 protein AED:1.00 eAED:1.00 QI:0/-1/0/0/-1/1/1/0/109